MSGPEPGWQRFRQEMAELLTLLPSERRWHMPLAAALACGIPLWLAAGFGQIAHGLAGTFGGLVFLYMPNTPMRHRMAVLMTCSFGMLACFTLGMLTHQFFPALLALLLALMTMLMIMVCRYYGVGPPGSLFFVMACAIGAYTPAEPLGVSAHVGALALGCLLACLIAFVYNLLTFEHPSPQTTAALRATTTKPIVLDAVVIGVFVGLSLALAQILQLDRPYWVPISCLAVIQGASLRAVWTRQAQRIAGTSLGLGVTWMIFQLPLNLWAMVFIMTALVFLIETLVVRNYGLAVVFITPLTILLAEAAHMKFATVGTVMQARFLDTVLGCLIGLIGGFCLHTFRERMAADRSGS